MISLAALLLLVVPVAPQPTNIVFVLADDLGYGDIGAFGQDKIQTPHLDRMAADGIVFSDFYAGSTVCAPSRCVLMTGKHTGHAWVRANGGSAAARTLPDSEVTVAEMLREQGYATALMGKWGRGELGTEGVPTLQGFDTFFGYLNQGHAHNFYPPIIVQDDVEIPLANDEHPKWVERKAAMAARGHHPHPGTGFSQNQAQYVPDLVADKVMDWVTTQARADRPFFLYWALNTPHANNERQYVLGDGQEVPDYGVYEDRDWKNPDKGQAAMVTRLDRDLGRLLTRLRELGIEENTLVIFTSDNGHHREGGNNPEFFDANGPLRGKKRDLYEGGIRVPTIMWWPGTIEAGRRTDLPSSFADFFATAADVSGGALPDDLDSISVVPTLRGEVEHQEKHDHLYWEFYGQGSSQAVRFGPWKAVRKPMLTGPIELYNLEEDLGETTDVAAVHPDQVARATELMQQSRTRSPHWRAPSEKKQSTP